MRDLQNKVAFITGGASGIGFGMAEAFIDAGMKVAIADIEQSALDAATARLGHDTIGLQLDVRDRDAMAAAADQLENTFGNIHVVCNNAGVTSRGPLDRATYDDWDWVLGVNLGGVINGVQTFLPRLKRHGDGGHIVNTASIAALLSGPGNGIYSTAKFGVLALSEALLAEEGEDGVGVSVLCPGAVQTNINRALRNKPGEFADAGQMVDDEQQELLERSFDAGSTPREMGDIVVSAIREKQFYILPHTEFVAPVTAKMNAILAAFPDEAPDADRVAHDQLRQQAFAKFWER